MNSIRNISLLLSDLAEDMKKLYILGWILSPIIVAIVVMIYILAGMMAFILLLDLFVKFLIKRKDEKPKGQ